LKQIEIYLYLVSTLIFRCHFSFYSSLHLVCHNYFLVKVFNY